ncbi:ABC transporter permease [Pseudomonas sp. dw_358]|uniref:ABC transporter permease n=1 Tax=Pseudomonas sp. dw_358 TaxID=2720083 RepID=UPI001BD3D198|nr:ABC transporter permease [Pseudomonas sp. dw_358]
MSTRPRILLLPAALLMVVFFSAFLVFAAVSLLHSASGTPGYSLPVTLNNYLRFFTDPIGLGVLGWTLVFSLALTAATLLVGYPFAYLIARTPRPWLRQLLLGALLVTFLCGSISRAYGWLILLGRRGLLNEALLWTGLIDHPLALIYNVSGVFIALLHFTLPYFVLTVFGAIRAVPPQIEESARDLGAGALRVFLQITVPLTLPAIVGGAALAFSLAISAFAFPLLLGGGRVRLISNYIYDQLFVAFDLPFAAAVSSIFLLVALAVLMSFFAIERWATHAVYRRAG